MPRKIGKEAAALVVVGFNVCFESMVYVPTLFPYISNLVSGEYPEGRSQAVFALVLSGTSLMQAVSSVAAEWLAKRIAIRWVMLALLLLDMAGTVLYGLAVYPLAPISAWVGPSCILIGRIFSGCSGGILSLSLLYITNAASSTAERQRATSVFRVVTLCAAIPATFVALILSIPALEFDIGAYPMSATTYPAWACLLAQLASVPSLFLISSGVKLPKEIADDRKYERMGTWFWSLGVVMGLTVMFYNGYIVSTITYGFPVMIFDAFQWTVQAYVPLVLLMAVLGVLAAAASNFLGQKLKQKRYLLVVPSIGFMCIMAVLMNCSSSRINIVAPGVGMALFVVAMELLYFGYGIEMSAMSIVFAQMVPKEYLVSMVPLTSFVYNAGKVLGPLLNDILLEVGGLGLVYLAMLVASVFAFFIAMFAGRRFRGRYIELATPGREDIASGPLPDVSVEAIVVPGTSRFSVERDDSIGEERQLVATAPLLDHESLEY